MREVIEQREHIIHISVCATNIVYSIGVEVRRHATSKSQSQAPPSPPSQIKSLISSILRRRPIVVPLLLPALLEGLHLPFASLVLCLWFGTKATSATRSAQDIPRPCKPASPSSRRSSRSAWCSPLHWSLISLSSQKDHRTAFPPAQPVLKILVSLIPVSIEVVLRNLDIGAPLIRLVVIVNALTRLAIALCVRHLAIPATWLLGVQEERRTSLPRQSERTAPLRT